MNYPWAVQRYRLYRSGVELPKLGTIRDVILRKMETLESKRQQKQTLFLAHIASQIYTGDPNGQRAWGQKISDLWQEYTNIEFGFPESAHRDTDKEMMDFYMKKVKNVKAHLKMKTTATGSKSMVVEGLDDIFGRLPDKPVK